MLFFKISFTLEGERGYKGMILFFLLHLTCGRKRGRGLVFFLKLYLSLLIG
jgi:hypothetical protein